MLHFEDGVGITNAKQCSERLKKSWPEYDKKIPLGKITRAMITAAVARAKKRDNPECSDWPRKAGSTTVYRLVEKILKAEDQKGSQ